MRSELAQKQSEQLDAYLQALRNQLNSQRQREAEKRWKAPNCWRKTAKTCRRHRRPV
jgi:small-conductance mechanosensitive channel